MKALLGRVGCEMEDSRAEFEKWFSDDGRFPRAVERGADGEYKLMYVRSAWKTWVKSAEVERERCARIADEQWVNDPRRSGGEAIRAVAPAKD